jgi:hypothetical protein
MMEERAIPALAENRPIAEENNGSELDTRRIAAQNVI